jgi:chromosome segregation ATPase
MPKLHQKKKKEISPFSNRRPDIDIGKLRQDLLDKLADGHEALVEQVKRMRAVETGAADSKEVQCTVKALEQNLGTRIGHIADAVKQTDESLLSTRKHISELMAVTLRDHSEKQREELSKLQKELEESITKSYAGLSKSFKEDRSAHVTLMQDKHDELKKSLISKEEVEEKHAALVKGLEATHGIVNKSIDSGLQPVLEQLDTLAKSQKELSERTAAASHGQHALDALAEKQQQQLKQVEQVVSQQLDRLSELMSVASNNQEMDKIVAKAETEAAVSAVRDEVQQVISSQLEKLSVSFVSDIKGIVGSTASDVRELHNLLDAQKSEIASIRGDIAKVLAIGVEEDKSVASGLRKEIQEMRAEKERLISQLGDLKAEIRVRGEEFDKLELRVTQFETRLNSTILDHSRSILGSATVAIINNGGRASAAAPASGDSDRQPMSKRNLSMIPGDQIHQDPTNDNDKENELTVAKRGSPFTSAKLRSISMFQGH